MAIAEVSANRSANSANSATSCAMPYTQNVVAGSLVTIIATKFSPSSDPFVVGDISQTAGTATLGSWSMDRDHNQDVGGYFSSAAAYSAIVTGSGSLTVTVGGGVAGSYFLILGGELTGSWDGSRVEDVNSAGSATDGTTSASSGNVTTAGAGVIVGGLALQITSGASVTITPDGAFTTIFENENTVAETGSMIFRTVGSGTTDAAEWTTGSNTDGWAAVAVAYKEAGGGGGSPAAGHMMLMGVG